MFEKKSVKEDLVSVIIPAYNCEEFIGVTLDSVINQTYQNWEAIVIDDCSTDSTAIIAQEYASKDKRIKCSKLEKNSGAAIARNKGVEIAKGKYMAFLDSDDLWFPRKLEKQIEFMQRNNYHFSCTSYTKINDQGESLDRKIIAKTKLNYNGVLRTCPGNSTVIYNIENLGKFKIPDIKKRNDYVMWLKVVKSAQHLYGYEEPLGSHRVRAEGISYNKKSLIKYHWRVYRNIEKLSFIKSSFLIMYWIIVTLFKLR